MPDFAAVEKLTNNIFNYQQGLSTIGKPYFFILQLIGAFVI